jgi:hypothetical protein
MMSGNWHLVVHGEVANWLIAGGTIGLALAALWALRELGEARSDRHVQILVAMGRRWESAEMTEALQDSRDYTPDALAELAIAARTGPKGDPTRAAAEKKFTVLLRVPNYFEDAGLISRVGRMADDLIDDYFGGVAIDEWSTWEPAIRRIQEKDSRAYEEFERLAKEDEREEEEQEKEAAEPSDPRST